MKSRLTIHRVLTFQALGLLALAPPTLHAAITKAASGTDLTAGPSWTGNTAPAAGDVATWASTSLGAGLMLNTDSSWLGMSVSGLLSDMDISGAGKLTLLGSGLSLSSVNLAVSTPVAIGATETWTANAGKTISLSGVVSGGSDLTKTGASTLVLSNASNTFSAATFLISDGVVKVTSSGALGSSSLKIDTRTAQLELDGASGNITLSNNFTTSNPYGTIRNSAGNNTINGAISMTSGGGNTKIISDGGSLVVAGAVSALSARNFDLGGTSTGANTFSGTLSSSNTPGLVKSDSGTWTLTANNTYTGTTTVSGGTLQLSGANGATSATPSYTLNGGTLVLDNTTAAGGNNNDRIADAATVTVNGGSLVYKGSDTVSSTESVGAMTAKTNNFVTGISSVTVTFGGTNAATLTAASLNHSAGNATLLVNGVNLGKDSSSSASVARFILTTAPPLVGTTTDAGTGINAASYNTKIVPYLLGEATPTTGGLGAASGTANTFGTYTVGSGFRPLNPTDEFTQNTITASNNTRITAATTATTTTAINSLVIAGDDLTIADGQALTATSGAVLFASSNAIKPATSTGSLALGTAEGMLTVNPGLTGTLSAVVTGSGGITKSGAGILALSNTNTYSGVTSIDGGVLRLDSAGALPGGIAATGGTSNLTFNGGVLGLATGDFKRSLNIATTANAVTFTGPGGWAAYGADRLVNLGGASASITPGTAGTGFNGKVLILGAASATHMVTLQNPLALGASYTIQVDDGAAPIDATLSGVVSGPWPIIKTGAGTLALSAANTNVLGGNPTQVTAGTLLVNGSLTAASNYVVVLRGATLGGSGSISGFVSVTSGASLQPTVTGTPGTLTLASSTSPAFYPDTKLKIRATSATALDKVSLTNANAVFTCGNLDLVIDCSSLSSTVVNQTIVQTTHAAGISGKFHSVTANNGYTAWVNYNANSITVILSSGAGPATTLQMTGFPSPQIAGVAGSVTVTAKDSIGIPATGYTGTIHFSSTDGAAAGLPADYTFVPGDGGTHTFTGVTLNTIGTQAITATDTVNSSLTATQSNISITGNPDKAMLTFTFPTWGAAAISGTNMSLIVPIGTPVTSLAPTYTVSPLATCLPASGTALDFTAPQTYTVTAQDNSTQVFTVSVTAGNAPVNFSWAAANSGNWSVAGNWTNEVALAPLVTAGQTNYTLSFNQSGSYTATNDLPAGFLLNQLNFGAATGTITLAGTNSLALTANDLTLPIIHQNSAAAVIIDPPISLASNTDFGGTGTGQVDLAGVISGTGSLTKDGPGTLKIYGLTPNTYSGGTIINSGTLHLGTMVSGISPSCTYTMGTGPVTLNGGTIEFDRVTAANALTSNGGTIVSPNGWGATWSGHVTLNAILTINSTSASPLNFTGGMSGSGGLIKMGNRTTILTGALTYTGNTTVNAGILSINSAFLADTSTVTIATGAQLDLNTAGASDTVATLVLGGVTVPPGTYNSLNPTYGAYFTGTGSLVVPVLGTPFELWAINHGLSGTDALPGADPDHDGLTNAMEFVLGGEPNPANAGANSLGLLPKPTRNLADDLVFTFPRSIASKSGASVNFQWSTDLSFPTGNDALVGVVSTAADAHGVTVDVTPGALGTDPDTIVITVPVANAPGGKVFGRLHVTVP